MKNIIVETFETCRDQLADKGAPFELEQRSIDNIPYRLFKNAPETMKELVNQGRKHGTAVFLHYEGEDWQFDQLFQQVDAIGYQLVHRYHLKPGDKVAIAMRNYPEWMSVYLAVVSLGAVVVPLNSWGKQEELLYALTDSSSSVVFCDQQRYDSIANDLVVTGIKAVVCRATSVIDHQQAETLEQFIAGAANVELPCFPVTSEAPAMIMYTSGTTGKPKGVVSNHRNICQAIFGFEHNGATTAMANPEFIQQMRSKGNPPCSLLAVPLFHVSGCYAMFLTSLRAGRKLVILYKWDAAKAIAMIAKHKITTLSAAPNMVMDVLDHPDFDQTDTSSLLSLSGGGAACPPRFKQLCHEKINDVNLGTGYGMTESNATGASFIGNLFEYKPASAGLKSPIVDIKTCDENGTELATGEVGEIWLRSPTIASGYLNQPEENKKIFVEGWLATGDIGYIDSEGFIFLVDRAKDIIIRGGENISAAEVESCLYDCPVIWEVAVFSLPDKKMGEAVTAVVTFKPGHAATTDELKNFVKEKLAAFKVPEHIYIHSEPLPRNAMGKPLKNLLKAQYGG